MNPIRSCIKGVLELIASKEKQIKYEQFVPIADVPAELICMWFDDNYHPDSWQCKQAFSAKEQQILGSFNDYYNSRCDKLPKSLVKLHADRLWSEIMLEAKKTKEAIKW